ncbi:polysaccharide deacetylase family protein [Streptomyces sp. NPDC006703]|uniref:polysaccharide deacetylase family protein n=1 Tax=Streptomyces sp. NPDC006703 TaxID=3364759 RepID=UPI0036A9CD56
MQLVGQKGKSRTSLTKAVCAAAALAATLLASGCSADDAGTGQHGAPAAKGPAGSLTGYSEQLKHAEAARLAAVKKWGLAKPPLLAPPAPAVKPRITNRPGFETDGGDSLPPVFTTVPTKDKIVFLTIDDGAEKDPQFLKMMQELRIPYTAFLSDYLVKDNHAYFKKMQSLGVTLNNHTLNHRYMPALSYDEQRHEICDQQDKIGQWAGERPKLFRPPYGNYNEDTLKAAQSCGIKAAPLWAEEAFTDHMEWREWDRDLHPGDIILTHFRGPQDWNGTMGDMVRQVMKVITDKGYAVARLEDYV